MATIEDVTTRLIKQTQEGRLIWRPTSISGREARVWQVDVGDCAFALYRRQVSLSMLLPNVGWRTLGEGG